MCVSFTHPQARAVYDASIHLPLVDMETTSVDPDMEYEQFVQAN